MRIAFIISSLSAGGAEKVLAQLATHFSEQGHSVEVLTLAPLGSDHYQLPASVGRVCFGTDAQAANRLASIMNNIRRVASLRSALCAFAPDVAVSFMPESNIITLLATRFTTIPVVISERISPLHMPIGCAWNFLRKRTYPLARGLVVQAKATRLWAEQFLPAEQVWVVPNPVSAAPTKKISIDNTSQEVLNLPTAPFIAAMGRLVFQKGFDLLLAAFSSIAADHPKWQLVVIGGPRGDGAEAENLKRQAEELGIGNRVTWCGAVNDPMPLLQHAELYVLSSRFEGFPNALTEAMACGLPVVAFDCPTGPADIVRHGVDGLLIPPCDPGALANGLECLMGDNLLRRKMGKRAGEVCARFSEKSIFKVWDRILTDAVRARRE